MTTTLESPPAVLSAPLERHARTYIAARRMTGVKLLEAIAALAAARDVAAHGEWGLFLEAVGLDESRARAQIRLHEACLTDASMRRLIESGALTENVARELLPAPPETRAALLDAPTPPTLADVRRAKAPRRGMGDGEQGMGDEERAAPPALPPLPEPLRRTWTRWQDDDTGRIGMRHTSGYILAGTDPAALEQQAAALARPLAELADHGWRVFYDPMADGRADMHAYTAIHEAFSPISAASVERLALAAWHERMAGERYPDMPSDVIDALWLAGFEWSGRAWTRGAERIDEHDDLGALRYELGLETRDPRPETRAHLPSDWQEAKARIAQLGQHLDMNEFGQFSVTDADGKLVFKTVTGENMWASVGVYLDNKERARSAQSAQSTLACTRCGVPITNGHFDGQCGPCYRGQPPIYRPTIPEWNAATARAAAIGLRISQADDGSVGFTRTADNAVAGGAVDWPAALELLAHKEQAPTPAAPTTPAPLAALAAKLTTPEAAISYRAIGMLLRASGVLPVLPVRPKAPRSADISVQTKYLTDLERYADAMERALKGETA